MNKKNVLLYSIGKIKKNERKNVNQKGMKDKKKLISTFCIYFAKCIERGQNNCLSFLTFVALNFLVYERFENRIV